MRKNWQLPKGYSIEDRTLGGRNCSLILREGKIVFVIWDKVCQNKINEVISRLEGTKTRKS